MSTIESQAQRANPAAISAILSDPRDEPLRNKATRVALEVLKLVPDLPSAGNEIMLTSLARYAGNSYVACSTSCSTVLFLGKHAMVLANKDGGHVPWVSTDKMNVPDMAFFECRIRVDDGLADHLLGYIEKMMRAEHLAAEAALAHGAAEQEEGERCAPAP
ncbi:MAG: hypothetical protein K2X55_12205 [Burkholderiaceae bacterium]|nr:hypothetical protein [Burkholderiaceae bacterium]